MMIPDGKTPNRLGYIGKEKDKENSLADHGVRKYDDGIGRFTSIDPLWEKYYSCNQQNSTKIVYFVFM